MKLLKYNWVLLSLLLLTNCSDSEDFSHHNVTGSDLSNDFVIDATMQSPFYIAFIEFFKTGKKKEEISTTLIKKEAVKYKNAIHFQVNINRTDGQNVILGNISNIQEYSQLVLYLNTRSENDFRLKNDHGKEFKPLSVLFDNTYGMLKSAKFNVVFPASAFDNSSELTLIYKGSVFGTGKISEIEFDVKKIRKQYKKLDNK